MKTRGKFIKGTSLVEVLAVLAIVSVAIIATMNVLVKANISIKSNEIQDIANDTLIRALELVKAPSNVLISASPSDFANLLTGSNSNNYYALKKSGSSNYLQFDPQYAVNAPLSSCSSSSFYYIPIEVNGVTQPYIFCMQLQFSPKTQVDGSRYYEVNVRIIYSLSGRPQIIEDYKTFRYGSFAAL